MFLLGGVLRSLVVGLGLNIFLKIIIVWVVAAGVTLWFIRPASPLRAVGVNSAIVALSAFVFDLSVWVIGGLWGLVIGFILFWVVVSSVLDRFYQIHYDQSYAYTGQIVGISTLSWLVIGLGLSMLS